MTDDFQVLHPDPLRRVELAMAELRAGRMVILTDDEDRENEGDLVCAAEKVTPELINFMASFARGLICLSITSDQVDKLGLPMMTSHNQSAYNTAFTVSIEAREGVTTGISAADRARTIQVAIRKDVGRYDIVTPGHIFPLRARSGGVLERVGQTEGSVDLCRLAGLDPSAVICEVMNDDGTMARVPDLLAFGRKHRMRMCSVADVIKWRMGNERIVHPEVEGTIDLPGSGTWRARLYRSLTVDGVHLALWKGDPGPEPTLCRVQVAPPSWSFLSPLRSSHAGPAQEAIDRIAAEGSGALVLMHLGAPSTEFLLRAFTRDHAEANPDPAVQPRAEALRDLGVGCQILRDLGLQALRLLTTSSRPVLGIEAYGLQITERLPVGNHAR